MDLYHQQILDLIPQAYSDKEVSEELPAAMKRFFDTIDSLPVKCELCTQFCERYASSIEPEQLILFVEDFLADPHLSLSSGNQVLEKLGRLEIPGTRFELCRLTFDFCVERVSLDGHDELVEMLFSEIKNITTDKVALFGRTRQMAERIFSRCERVKLSARNIALDYLYKSHPSRGSADIIGEDSADKACLLADPQDHALPSTTESPINGDLQALSPSPSQPTSNIGQSDPHQGFGINEDLTSQPAQLSFTPRQLTQNIGRSGHHQGSGIDEDLTSQPAQPSSTPSQLTQNIGQSDPHQGSGIDDNLATKPAQALPLPSQLTQNIVRSDDQKQFPANRHFDNEVRHQPSSISDAEESSDEDSSAGDQPMYIKGPLESATQKFEASAQRTTSQAKVSQVLQAPSNTPQVTATHQVSTAPHVEQPMSDWEKESRVKFPELFAWHNQRVPMVPLCDDKSMTPWNKLTFDTWFRVLHKLTERERCRLTDVCIHAHRKYNEALIRVNCKGAWYYEDVFKPDTEEIMGHNLRRITVEDMEIIQNWRVVVTDPEVRIWRMKENMQDDDIRNQYNRLERGACQILKNLLSIPCRSKVTDLHFVNIAFLGTSIFLKTNIINYYFPNTKSVEFDTCSDVPLDEMLSKGLHELPVAFTYFGDLPGMHSSSQNNSDKHGVLLNLLFTYRQAQRDFLENTPGQTPSPAIILEEQLKQDQGLREHLLLGLNGLNGKVIDSTVRVNLDHIIDFVNNYENSEELAQIHPLIKTFAQRILNSALTGKGNQLIRLYTCAMCSYRKPGICFSGVQRASDLNEQHNALCLLCAANQRCRVNWDCKGFEDILQHVPMNRKLDLQRLTDRILSRQTVTDDDLCIQQAAFEIPYDDLRPIQDVVRNRKQQISWEIYDRKTPKTTVFEFICPWTLRGRSCQIQNCQLLQLGTDNNLLNDNADLSRPDTIVTCAFYLDGICNKINCKYAHDHFDERKAMASNARIQHHKTTGF